VTAERPPYGSVLWPLVPAWLAAALVTAAAGAALQAATGAEPVTGGVVTPWLFPLDDAWGWLANAPLAVLHLACFSLLARRVLPRGPRGERVAAWPLAAVLAATTALAELPRPAGEGAGPDLLAWLLAAWLIRRLPWRPDDAPLPRGRRLLPAASGLVAVAVLLPLLLAYAERHPLALDHAACTSASVSEGTCSLREGRRFTVSAGVRNAAGRDLRITGVRATGLPRGFRVERVRRIPGEGFAERLALPQPLFEDRTLELLLDVRVPRGGCTALLDDPPVGGLEVRTTERAQRLRFGAEADLQPVECVSG